ncbi:MAG: electron transporter RnfC, partial [Oscillospiraceae bacterium]|nr:electron transporter RnfC [Oscillospiraceae bacterium]
MPKLTFRGGVHPKDQKAQTCFKSIRRLEVPEILVFPLSQHIGAPCKPLVAKGDRVLKGMKIADSDAFVSAPIHSSVSGEVL